MIYYGIVDKIKAEHKSGLYGRRKLTAEEMKDNPSLIRQFLLSGYDEDQKEIFNDLLSVAHKYVKYAIKHNLLYQILKGEQSEPLFSKKHKSVDIVLQIEDNQNGRKLVFDNSNLNNDYSFGPQSDLFYGLFDDNFPIKDNAFKAIMNSKGGSTFIIIERNSLPPSMHFGGTSGRFNYGLYCSHPKDEKLLIPLENSNELIKTLILEETIRAYEALGAKKIIIEDITNVNAGAGGEGKGVGLNMEVSISKQILREKQFGKGTFDPERALKESLFIHDFPNIMTTVQGRIKGNQTIERFTEKVNLSVGLDVGVLKLFEANANFEYNRTWFFEVEFYDKNDNL